MSSDPMRERDLLNNDFDQCEWEWQDKCPKCGDPDCTDESIMFVGLRRWPCEHGIDYYIRVWYHRADEHHETGEPLGVCAYHLAGAMPIDLGDFEYIRVEKAR